MRKYEGEERKKNSFWLLNGKKKVEDFHKMSFCISNDSQSDGKHYAVTWTEVSECWMHSLAMKIMELYTSSDNHNYALKLTMIVAHFHWLQYKVFNCFPQIQRKLIDSFYVLSV